MSNMKAMVYHGANNGKVEICPIPEIIDASDAIIKMTKTTICGTDLGILKGKNPEIDSGRILGHEGIGIVEKVGSSVKNFKPGDKVIISCISRCGTCENCQHQLYSHCENGGGWILGHLIDGTQAEYVRIPFADNSLYKMPDNLNEDSAVLLSDALPTAHEIGVQYGDVKPGDTVVIVGAGPVGMSALLTAQLYSPSKIIVIDMDDNRLAMAKEAGASDIINPAKTNAAEVVMQLTGKGVDCAIEAVGVPETWELCQKVVKPGGHIAVVGVHGKATQIELQKLWIENLTITTGLVNANTTAMLMKTCCSGALNTKQLITHHYKFSEIEAAYDTFKHASDTKAMKVIIDF